jgi:hypothetical protein
MAVVSLPQEFLKELKSNQARKCCTKYLKNYVKVLFYPE